MRATTGPSFDHCFGILESGLLYLIWTRMPYGHARSCVARTTDSIMKTPFLVFFCFADFTLYMSFLRHMADTHERAY